MFRSDLLYVVFQMQEIITKLTISKNIFKLSIKIIVSGFIVFKHIIKTKYELTVISILEKAYNVTVVSLVHVFKI